MKTSSLFPCSIVITLLCAGVAFADAEPHRALYSSVNVLLAGSDRAWLAEMKVSAGQQQALEAGRERRNKIWQRYNDEREQVRKSKASEVEKNARMRALETRVSEDLFRDYSEVLRPDQIKRMKQITAQVHGMDVFDFPEVRQALKIGDQDVKKLREAYNKYAKELRADLEAQLKAKLITNEQAAKKATGFTCSVPEKVRLLLDFDQRKVLDDLLGPDPAWR